MAGGVDQKLDFSGTTTEYACVVTTESVVLRPARNSSYTVTVNSGQLDGDGTYTLPLAEGQRHHSHHRRHHAGERTNHHLYPHRHQKGRRP